MTWPVEFVDDGVRATLEAMPTDIVASFLRITRLIETEGLPNVREPYVKHLDGRIWEMRLKGRDGIARAAYDALEDEFALARALIRARGDADMTQEQVAQAMGTTQAVIARLESGRVMPSTRTLERFAKATGTRLRINFEPEKRRSGASH